jgi:hypothetical protein
LRAGQDVGVEKALLIGRGAAKDASEAPAILLDVTLNDVACLARRVVRPCELHAERVLERDNGKVRGRLKVHDLSVNRADEQQYAEKLREVGEQRGSQTESGAQMAH